MKNLGWRTLLFTAAALGGWWSVSTGLVRSHHVWLDVAPLAALVGLAVLWNYRIRPRTAMFVAKASPDGKVGMDPGASSGVSPREATCSSRGEAAFLQTVGSLVPTEVGALWWLDDRASAFRLHAQCGAAEAETPLQWAPLEEGPVRWVLQSQRALVIQDAPVEMENTLAPLPIAYRSAVYLPLCLEDQILGLLAVGHRRPGIYHAPQVAHLARVARQSVPRLYHEHLGERLERIYSETLMALVNTVEARDEYLLGHPQRVAHICRTLAATLDLAPAQREALHLAALLHDVGRIDSIGAITQQNRSLRPDEWEQVRQYPLRTAEVLQPLVEEPEVVRTARHHHERYDGQGYPDRLAGEDIPLGARILALADSYDALTSPRPYRRAFSIRESLAHIAEAAGSQFDPGLVRTFLRTPDAPWSAHAQSA